MTYLDIPLEDGFQHQPPLFARQVEDPTVVDKDGVGISACVSDGSRRVTAVSATAAATVPTEALSADPQPDALERADEVEDADKHNDDGDEHERRFVRALQIP